MPGLLSGATYVSRPRGVAEAPAAAVASAREGALDQRLVRVARVSQGRRGRARESILPAS